MTAESRSPLTVDDHLRISTPRGAVYLTPRQAFNFAEDVIRAAARLAIRQESLEIRSKSHSPGSAPKARIDRRPVRSAASRGKCHVRLRRNLA